MWTDSNILKSHYNFSVFVFRVTLRSRLLEGENPVLKVSIWCQSQIYAKHQLLLKRVVPRNCRLTPTSSETETRLRSGISLQRTGCFPVNVSMKYLHFTKTVLCKHTSMLSHFTCSLLKSEFSLRDVRLSGAIISQSVIQMD